VLAGANGAGKSTIGGEALRAAGVNFFDPDAAARRIRGAQPDLAPADVNSMAWHQGRRLLERAIADRLDFALETTLGGETMTALLERAVAAGSEVRVWYVGLASQLLHIERVRRRVAKGGHDIPEADIRRRYDQSHRTRCTRGRPASWRHRVRKRGLGQALPRRRSGCASIGVRVMSIIVIMSN
jgi:predicted ABC-type ATPase